VSLPFSAISSVVDRAQSVNATKLRDLDAFEEFLWHLEQNVSMFHTVVVEVTGRTTIHQWKHALDAVQIRYPLLSASIRKIPGQRPFFEKVHGASIPLRVVPLTDSLILEGEMERDLEKPFGDGSGSLTRGILFHAQDRTVVLFSTHHSSLDGKSHLLLVQDLLASVAGETLDEPLKVQPGIGQLLGLPEPAAYPNKLEGRPVAAEDGARIKVPKANVRRLQLSVDETQALIARAREEGTTVHAALVAALTLAGKRHSKKWRDGPVRCMSPIDMRKTLQLPDEAGMLISGHATAVPTPDGASLWDIARSVREDMLPARSADEAKKLLLGLGSLVAEEQTSRDVYWSAINGPMLHELVLTNYAGYRVRTEYGNLKIRDIFTGSPSMISTQQKVSVLTVNGRLGMTLAARDAFPTLLEDARVLLTAV
jgi:hypothetical protein